MVLAQMTTNLGTKKQLKFYHPLGFETDWKIALNYHFQIWKERINTSKLSNSWTANEPPPKNIREIFEHVVFIACCWEKHVMRESDWLPGTRKGNLAELLLNSFGNNIQRRHFALLFHPTAEEFAVCCAWAHVVAILNEKGSLYILYISIQKTVGSLALYSADRWDSVTGNCMASKAHTLIQGRPGTGRWRAGRRKRPFCGWYMNIIGERAFLLPAEYVTVS
jgi:hypothetical protein